MHHDETSAAAPIQGRFLESDARRDALARLSEGLGLRAPFLLLTGESGAGKTALMRDVVASWGDHAVVAFLANAAMNRTEFVEHILRRFGVDPPPEATKPQLLDRIEKYVAEAEGRGQVPVIVIDDAHELSDELLGELRLLANASVLTNRPLEIALVGLPVLEERLAEAALEPVRQRISVRCRLLPFTQPETRRYLHEIVSAAEPEGPEFLPRKTCREVFKRTGGTPRAINVLVAEAMRRARASDARIVTPELAAEVAADLRMGTGRPDDAATPTARGSAAAPPPASPARSASTTAPVAPARPTAASGTANSSTSRPAASIPAGKPIVADGGPSSKRSSEPSPPGAGRSEPASQKGKTVPPGRVDSARPAPGAGVPARTPSHLSAASDDGAGPLPVVDTPAADHNDPRVGEWIGRFIKPDEPRFGELLMAAIPGKPRPLGARDSQERGSAHEESHVSRPVRSEIRTSWEGDDRQASPDLFEDFTGTHGIAWEAEDLPLGEPVPRVRRHDVPVARDPKKRTVWHRPPMSNSLPVAGVLVAVVFLAALIVLPRARRPATPGQAVDSSAVAAAKSASKRAVSQGTSKKVAGASSSTAPSSSQDKAPEERYSLDVGMYLNPERAQAERDRIVEATGLRGWLVRGSRDGADMYHVVVGSYRSKERAQQSAEQLLERGMVFEALVVPLPPKNQRR